MIAFFTITRSSPKDIVFSPNSLDDKGIPPTNIPSDDKAIVNLNISYSSLNELQDKVPKLLRSHALKLSPKSKLIIRVIDNQLTAWITPQ